LEPQEIRMLLTPRNTVASALDWLKLQRNWWQGTTPPRSVPEEVKPWPYYLDLTDDWACLPLKEDNTEDQTPLAAPDHDDSLWKRMPLQAWVVGEELPTSHAIFRKRFSVPPTWSDGQIYLWIHSWTTNSGVHGRMRVWLDGKEITSKPPKPNRGLAELELTDTCPPGTDHYLAVEVIGEGRIPGVYGETWLTYMPNPKKVQDLAGEWTPSPDALHFGLPVTFPGAVEAQTVRRKIHVDAAHAGQAVFLHVISKPGWTGVLVNGHYVRRSRHAVGDVLHLNITPWIRFGEVNEIELAQPAGAYKRQVRKVGLWFYDTKEYP